LTFKAETHPYTPLKRGIAHTPVLEAKKKYLINHKNKKVSPSGGDLEGAYVQTNQ